MALLTLPEIRSYVRGDFSTADQGFLSDAEIDRWVNEGYLTYVHRLMLSAQGFFETMAFLDITANTETIAMPNNFAGSPGLFEMVIVERVLPNGNVPLQYRKRFDEVNPTVAALTGYTYLPTYDFRGQNLVLEPAPTNSETGGPYTGGAQGGGLRIVYKYLPQRLESAQAQAGGATTITLSATSDPRDNYYNGARIYIVSGTGIGQLNTITDYVGSTKVATVGAWVTPPDSTSVYSTLIHDDFPESFYELLPLYACKKAFLKERSFGSARNYDLSALKEKEKMFWDATENRTQARVFVQPFHPELRF